MNATMQTSMGGSVPVVSGKRFPIALLPTYVMALIFTTCIPCAKGDEYQQSYSKQKLVWLDPGEQCVFLTNKGQEKTIRLISVEERKDTVIHRVRDAVVVVTIGGEPLRLICGPYVMPTVVNGIRIQADTTQSWVPDIPKQVQFSVWNEADPIVDLGKFGFPFQSGYDLFSQGMQTYNEMVWRGWNDDGFEGNPLKYHNYGIDITGYEKRDVVHSGVSGEIMGTWLDSKYDPGSVMIIGDDGLYWEYGHMDSVEDSIKKGTRIEKGEQIGISGNRGPSGKITHLHFGSYTPDGVKSWQFNQKLNLYPWYVTAYQGQYRKNLYSVAGDHHILYEGEKIVLDGSNSLSYDSKIKSFKWVFCDGSSMDGKIVEKVYDKPGVYSAGLWVEDELGKRDVSFCEVRVYPKQNTRRLPRIYMTCTPNYMVEPGQNIYFTGCLQGVKTRKVEIDFGDGSKIRKYIPGTEITYKYKKPDIYVVTTCFDYEGYPIRNRIKITVNKK